MPRDVTSDMSAALQSANLAPAVFVEAHFANEIVYVWTGIGDISWNSQTWKGVGALGSIGTIEDGSAVEAKGTTIALSGLNQELLNDALNDYQTGLPVKIYLGLFNEDDELIDSPIRSFIGRMDLPTVSVAGDTSTITISCENLLLDMNTSVERRYTNEDQRIDHPEDRGFEFVNAIQDVTIFWGRVPTSNGNFTVQGAR